MHLTIYTFQIGTGQEPDQGQTRIRQDQTGGQGRTDLDSSLPPLFYLPPATTCSLPTSSYASQPSSMTTCLPHPCLPPSCLVPLPTCLILCLFSLLTFHPSSATIFPPLVLVCHLPTPTPLPHLPHPTPLPACLPVPLPPPSQPLLAGEEAQIKSDIVVGGDSDHQIDSISHYLYL